MKFADTNFILALLNPNDQWHLKATAVSRDLDEHIVTTTWVLMELGGALSSARHRQLFLRFIDRLAVQPDWEVVPATAGLFDRAVELFRTRPDKDWTLTDCSSFVVMSERNIADALTNDHHFEQAGFRALLK